MANVHTPGPQVVPDIDLRSDRLRGPPSDVTSEDRTDEQQKQDAELANRLSQLIEDANQRVVPLTNMIRQVRHANYPTYSTFNANNIIAHRSNGGSPRR